MDHELVGWEDPAARLRQALDKNELALFCQPVLALKGAQRYSFAEALVRLREEEDALLPPGDFLPIFEHYGMMPQLDRWVVRELLGRLAKASRIPRFSVNLASQSLEDASFASSVAAQITSCGLPGSALIFEIDEMDTLVRLPAAEAFADAIRPTGAGVLIDGFGRRSVSFAAFKALKPNYVKVDGSIIRKILSHPTAEAKLRTILRVGEVVGLEVIAECVEEQDVLVRLKALGVDHAQGFGIYQPHAIDALTTQQP